MNRAATLLLSLTVITSVCSPAFADQGFLSALPSAVARQTARELDTGVRSLTHDSPCSAIKIPATIIALPFATFAGCVEGAVYALRYRNNDASAPDNMHKS